jgi:glycosyltransferase involved in cell wall biosynthesis
LIGAVKGMPRVHVLNGVPQPSMTEVYKRYDVLLLASETEGLSIAMLEAMAHGLVPVVTKVSGAEDLIINAKNGFLCEVGAVKVMAQRILTLSSDRSLLHTMSENAYETIRKGYLLESHARSFANLIDLTLKKPLVSERVALSCLQTEPEVAIVDSTQDEPAK